MHSLQRAGYGTTIIIPASAFFFLHTVIHNGDKDTAIASFAFFLCLLAIRKDKFIWRNIVQIKLLLATLALFSSIIIFKVFSGAVFDSYATLPLLLILLTLLNYDQNNREYIIRKMAWGGIIAGWALVYISSYQYIFYNLVGAIVCLSTIILTVNQKRNGELKDYLLILASIVCCFLLNSNASTISLVGCLFVYLNQQIKLPVSIYKTSKGFRRCFCDINFHRIYYAHVPLDYI